MARYGVREVGSRSGHRAQSRCPVVPLSFRLRKRRTPTGSTASTSKLWIRVPLAACPPVRKAKRRPGSERSKVQESKVQSREDGGSKFEDRRREDERSSFP